MKFSLWSFSWWRLLMFGVFERAFRSGVRSILWRLLKIGGVLWRWLMIGSYPLIFCRFSVFSVMVISSRLFICKLITSLLTKLTILVRRIIKIISIIIIDNRYILMMIFQYLLLLNVTGSEIAGLILLIIIIAELILI